MAQQEAVTLEELSNDSIMPEGWTDGSDIFDESTYSNEGNGALDALTQAFEEQAGEPTGAEEANTTTVGESEDMTGENEDDDSDTTDEATDESSDWDTTRVSVVINHVPQEVEIKREDLPTLYQKSQALDKYQEKVRALEAELKLWDKAAKGLEYDNRDDLRKGLIDNTVQNYVDEHPGVPEEMARDYISRKFDTELTPAKAEGEPVETPTTARDWKPEVAELLRHAPEFREKKIPDEVAQDAISTGKTLLGAYFDYVTKQATAANNKANQASKENKILKQNQAAAAKAPVSPVTGKGKTVTSEMDDFLMGFDSDRWG